MSMGYARCPSCGASDGEKLFAIDNMFECYCPSCETGWQEEPQEYEIVTRHQQWMLENYGEE